MELLLLGELEVGDLLREKGLDDLLAIEVPTSCKINQPHATFTIINLSHLAFRCGGVHRHLVFELIS